MRMNDKENNAMVRDFSGEAKQELLQYVDSIISKTKMGRNSKYNSIL